VLKTVQVNGRSQCVWDQGTGPVLLFVHGFPLDHTMWQRQIAELREMRIVAPDLRGFGGSDSSAGKVTMQDFADDLVALLDALQIQNPVNFCGLSMGGYIAWQFWSRHAPRLARLILCDTRAAADAESAVQDRRVNAQRVLNEGMEFLSAAMSSRLFAPETHTHQPLIVSDTCAVMRRTDPRGAAAALLGMAERPDITPMLPRIRVPTLVVCGAHDAIAPPDEMRGIAAAIPAARYLEVPHAGHMAPLEQPHLVNAALRDFILTG